MSLINLLRAELPFSRDELLALIRTAPYRYKTYEIPKRQEGKFRTIAQPSREVKLIQSWLNKRVFGALPIHNSAMAYRKGHSIADHAEIHAGRRFLLKMDFKDFFPSILEKDIFNHLAKFSDLPEEDVRAVCQLVCWRDKVRGVKCLSIGAPSSPILSNSLLYEFDKKVVSAFRGHKVSYSRYADDLAFSTNRKEVLSNVEESVRAICNEIQSPRLVINREKTVNVSRRHRRVLVGLVLTPDGSVSLGRERKRRLRSAIYRFIHDQVKGDDLATLRGELAFAWSVEKTFVASLVRQFGAEVFEKLDLPFGAKE